MEKELMNTQATEAVTTGKPKGGNFIQNKPYNINPVLERIAIITETHDKLKADINATDTAMITVKEVIAFNALAKAFEDVLSVSKELL